MLYNEIGFEGDNKPILGVPLQKREQGKKYPKTGAGPIWFVDNDETLVFASILDDDLGSLNWLQIKDPEKINQLEIKGLKLEVKSQLDGFTYLEGNQFSLQYNVNGETFYYLTEYINDNGNRYLQVKNQLIGNRDGSLYNGKKLSISYDRVKALRDGKVSQFITAYTTATSPSQLVLLDINEDQVEYIQISDERVLGIPREYLSEGEDASYTSFDGLRIPSRLYLPSPKLNTPGPYPLVQWIHGGPQGQEVPDFTWFSMPLIQYLTLNGFAVSVPNVRGSTGYGSKYMEKVERDWGGDDMKDHVHGLSILEQDSRIDSNNRFVAGRSYGGFMTLSLISRHPELWRGGVGLFGP
jgi:dipeptidyl aminopeptidase/acylaminoacyl peptidase